MDANFREPLSLLAYLYIENNKFDKAFTLLHVLRHYFPEDIHITHCHSYALFKMGDYSSALQEAEHVIKYSDDNDKKLAAAIIKSKSLWSLGKEKAARHTLSKQLKETKLSETPELS